MNAKASPKAKPAVRAVANPALEQDVIALKENVNEINSTLDQVVAQANENTANLSEIKSLLLAKHHPVVTNKYLESAEQFQGDEGDARFVDKPDGSTILQVPDGTDIGDPLMKEKLDLLAWNEGMIDVYIQDRSDEQMPQIFDIQVNGETQLFTHGKQHRVKRKFVEGLARAKPSRFGNEERHNPVNGEKEYVYPVSKGQKYGFALVNPTPKEGAWIKSIMAQP